MRRKGGESDGEVARLGGKARRNKVRERVVTLTQKNLKETR